MMLGNELGGKSDAYRVSVGARELYGQGFPELRHMLPTGGAALRIHP